MSRLLFLVFTLPAIAGQLSVPAAPRTLQNIARPLTVEAVEFVDFRFEQPQLYHLRAHYGPIEGEPTVGVQYGVEAVIGGDEAIAFAVIDFVDQSGRRIQQVPMAAESWGGFYRFFGLVTVPDQPFRVLLSGESVDGKTFRQLLRRLFTPVRDQPAAEVMAMPPGMPAEMVAGLRQMYEAGAAEARTARQALIASNPGGRIVIPTFEISNVTYSPLLSSAGRPLGVRMTYEVVFSKSGRHAPGLTIFPEDKTDFIVGRNPLHPLRNSIVPRPREVHDPSKEAQDMPGLLSQRVDFLYEAQTIYRFAVDLVPNFIIIGRDKEAPCWFDQRFRMDRDPATAFTRMTSNEGPTTYRVVVGGSAFEAKIEEFYGEGTFYRNFLAEGGRKCEEIGGGRN